MRHWAPHVAAKEAPPNDRCKHMLALHCKQSFTAISRVAEGEPGHSILGPNMPIEEEPDYDPSKPARVEFPAASGGPGAPEGLRGSSWRANCHFWFSRQKIKIKRRKPENAGCPPVK